MRNSTAYPRLQDPNWWDHWILEGFAIGPRALALCRMVFSGYILFFLLQRIDWIGAYPQVFFDPQPSLALLLQDFPAPAFFYVLSGALVISLLLLFVGWHTRWASLAFALCFLTYSSLSHAFGKIDHISLIFAFPTVMAFSNWGAALSVDALRDGKQQEVQHWPLALLALILGFSYFTASVYKFQEGWLALDTQAVYGNIVMNAVANERHFLLADFFAGLQAPLLWEIADWVIVLLDFTFLPVILFPRLFRTWIYFATLFHLMVMLSMAVDFSLFACIYLPFYDWQRVKKGIPRVVETVQTWWTGVFRRCHPLVLALVAGALILVLYQGGSLYALTMQALGWDGRLGLGLIFLLGMSGLAIVLSALHLRDLRRNGSPRHHIDQ